MTNHLQLLLSGLAYGECEHPAADSPYFRHINKSNASHRVRTPGALRHASHAFALIRALVCALQFLDLRWDGNDLVATILVMHHTRAGAAVRDLYLNGERYASSRSVSCSPHACVRVSAAWRAPAAAGPRCTATPSPTSSLWQTTTAWCVFDRDAIA